MTASVGSAVAPSEGVTDAWPVGLGVLPPPQAARNAATPAIEEPWRNTRRVSGRARRRWSRSGMRASPLVTWGSRQSRGCGRWDRGGGGGARRRGGGGGGGGG